MIANVRCPWSEIEARFNVTDPTGHIQKNWLAGVFYEQSGLLRDAWERFKDDRPAFVLDVGASVGNHAVWFSKALGASVYGFEPHRESRLHAVENIILNEIDERTVVFGYAIGRHTTRCSVEQFGGEGMIRTVPGSDVPMTSIDLLSIARPDVIKIDVEGHEMRVLEGARRTLKKFRPVLYVEGDQLALEMWCNRNEYRLAATFNATPTHRLEPV